jgi:hypothetical protein
MASTGWSQLDLGGPKTSAEVRADQRDAKGPVVRETEESVAGGSAVSALRCIFTFALDERNLA